MRRFKAVQFCTFLVAVLLCSCAVEQQGPRLVKAPSLKDRTDIPKIKDGDSSCPLKIRREGEKTFVSTHLVLKCRKDVFRLKCEALRRQQPIIECMVNEKKSNLLLDTGCFRPFFIDDSVVLTHKLPVYLNDLRGKKDDKGETIEGGLSYISKLTFGELEIRNSSCVYSGIHLDPPISDPPPVVMGIPILKKFSYVLFDQEKNELEFAHNNEFRPPQGERWASYPMELENRRIYIKIPIAGREERFVLDTGAQPSLIFTQSEWELVKKGLNQTVKMKKHRNSFVGVGKSYVGEIGVVPEIRVGERSIQNALVLTYPDDAQIFTNFADPKHPNAGIMGMQCFKDTVMVLDFKHQLVWVKAKSGGQHAGVQGNK